MTETLANHLRADLVRKAVAWIVGSPDNPEWNQDDTDAIIVWGNGRWASPQTFGSMYGSWSIAGRHVTIVLDDDGDGYGAESHDVPLAAL